MKIKKVLLGLALFGFLGAMSTQSVKAEWVDPSGTARGFAADFCYVVETNYNKGVTQAGAYDDVKSAGGENRKYSDGQVWLSKGYSGTIKTTNASYSKNPITKVEVKDTSIATVSLKNADAPAYREYTITSKEYGVTSIFVQRKNGDSFTIPVNVCKRVVLASDEGKTEKEMAMGVGQAITPIYNVKSGVELNNKVVAYKWTTDNGSVAKVSDKGEILAKAEGTAIITCRVYDSVACFNRYHYEDNYEGLVIRYKVRVLKNDPTIDIYGPDNKKINKEVISKKVGDVFRIRPTIPVDNASFEWIFSSSNENVAVIDEVGNVSIIGEGVATIKVCGLGQEQTFKIDATGNNTGKVVRKIDSIKLSIPGNKIIVGNSLNLGAYIITNPINTKIYSCTAISSNEGIIEIVNHSSIVGKKVGKSVISVTVTDYKNNKIYAKATVYVTLKTPTIQCKAGKKSNKISISKVDNAVSYTIYRSTNESSGYQKIGTTKTLSFVDKKIKSSKRYFYKVQANYKDGACNSALSKSVSSKLPAPKIKSIKKKGNIYVIKIKGQQFTGFEVYYGKNKKAKTKIGTAKSKKFGMILKLKKGKKYYFKIRAFEKKDNTITRSSFSKAYKFKR